MTSSQSPGFASKRLANYPLSPQTIAHHSRPPPRLGLWPAPIEGPERPPLGRRRRGTRLLGGSRYVSSRVA